MIDQATELAVEMADAARGILAADAAGRPKTEVKADRSLVTALDKAIEQRLRAMIAERFPDHGIIGEEFGISDGASEYTWVLDPIDGTAQFIAGLPVYGILIALARNATPVLGVVDHPATDDRWIGRPDGTTRNGASVSTSQCADPARALLSTSSPDYYAPDQVESFRRLRAAASWTVYGGSCYAYAMLASGRTDIAVDSGLDPVDVCALVPVIEGAGGVITDWTGAPITIQTRGHILATANRRLHDQALGILNYQPTG